MDAGQAVQKLVDLANEFEDAVAVMHSQRRRGAKQWTDQQIAAVRQAGKRIRSAANRYGIKKVRNARSNLPHLRGANGTNHGSQLSVQTAEHTESSAAQQSPRVSTRKKRMETEAQPSLPTVPTVGENG